MKNSIRVLVYSALVGILSSPAFGAEDDLRMLVRGGCLDEANCCFGRWKVTSAADLYQTEDAIDKAGSLKAGEEVEASSGRVMSEPGKLKIVFKHGEWKAGQTIGLYSEPDENGKARVGTAMHTTVEDLRFVKRGSKCGKPSKDCWAVAQSQPKIKWMIKVKAAANPKDKESVERSGWVDSTHIATDSECNL